METATAASTPMALDTRWTYLLAYLAAVIVAESLIAIPGGGFQPIGLSIHILLVFTLLFGSVIVQSRDPTMAPLLVATSLASLIRVFSLAVPRYNFLGLREVNPLMKPELDPLNTLPWLALVSVPLLVSVASVAYVQRLHPKELGLRFGRWRDIPMQTAIAFTGIPLGVIEYLILRLQLQPWINSLAVSSLVAGSVVIFFATGLSEELIFRGILLRRAVEGLGERGGLLLVTAIFTSLHIFFLNGVDLAFVALVGLFYGVVVLRTKNLWGAIFSHSLGNVILYLVAPNIK